MRTVIIVIALLAACAAQAQVNRCVDAAGKVSYTDGTCPAKTSGAQVQAGRTNAELELDRERAQLARERFLLEQEKRGVRQRHEPQQAAADHTPQQPRIDSYACDVAKRNLGVGISKDSKERSQREYETACFGSEAAGIEKARAGAPKYPRTIIINNPGP